MKNHWVKSGRFTEMINNLRRLILSGYFAKLSDEQRHEIIDELIDIFIEDNK